MKKKQEILDIIYSHKYPVISYKEYEGILSAIKELWGYRSMNKANITEKLLQENIIQEGKLTGKVDDTSFYIKTDSSFDVFDIASMRSRSSYFSHYSAIFINNLSNQIPKQIYLTLERTYTQNISEEITQDAVDKAFAKKPRITSNKKRYKRFDINFINGQGQNEIGVVDFRNMYRVTDVERTLIDASVRPFYCGGVTQVLDAFNNAKDTIDLDKLFHYYSMMKFTYPYHNIIGFYLENSGYNGDDFRMFKEMCNSSSIAIYLTYNMTYYTYSNKWNIYYPKGLI